LHDHLTLDDLVYVARAGGGLELHARRFTATELLHLARSVLEGSTLVLRDVEHLSREDLAQIAKSCPGHVRFSG
jgi:hypothetical protein